METILGIDLGTTNSAVSVIQEGRPKVLRDAAGELVVPSVVGLDREGGLLVGQEARNQSVLAPERTIRSIKRRMGEDLKISMGEEPFSPQEISSMILRRLKDRAAEALGRPVSKAVITVPAFFNEVQREATREAGELAGLEVVRIINEPTAASLMYEPSSEKSERLLIYDLGGGTLDVSIVQVEQGVVEVLASHGDTQLGGDDFDQLLFDHLCDAFERENDTDPRSNPAARSRLLQAAEEAKKRLSYEAFTTIAEEFVAEKDGKPLHLKMEIERMEYEELIGPLLQKTLLSVDAAMDDAGLTPQQLDRVLLVGGSTRTPMVHHLLKEQLHDNLHSEIDPDLCVSLGAALQGGLIAGIDVGPVLVDITPHTLGIRCLGEIQGRLTDQCFSPIIVRNTPLPASRSESYLATFIDQQKAHITVFQGENEDASFNDRVGEFYLEGLDEEAEQRSEIIVRFDLNLDGILTVTAIERGTGLEKRLRIDNTIMKFRTKDREEAMSKLAVVFGESSEVAAESEARAVAPDEAELADREATVGEPDGLVSKVNRLIPRASAEDAEEMQILLGRFEQAAASNDAEQAGRIREQLDDLAFYLEDA